MHEERRDKFEQIHSLASVRTGLYRSADCVRTDAWVTRPICHRSTGVAEPLDVSAAITAVAPYLWRSLTARLREPIVVVHGQLINTAELPRP